MSIVSNTGPLIALAKVDLLGLLQQRFTQVHIPPAVQRELLAKTGPEAIRLDHAFDTFLKIAPRPLLPAEVKAATVQLDLGEQEAIALAYDMRQSLLLDEQLGRQAARQLGLTVTGVVGVLIEAKKANLLPSVRPVMVQMRVNGYWFSDELLDLAAKLAGET